MSSEHHAPLDRRISRHQMFMGIAHIVAMRSTCARLNVGAVLVCKRRIVSIGYNGHKIDEPHCAGNECKSFRKAGTCPTTHAEVNALDYLDDSFAIRSLDMYVTDSPCGDCYDHIVLQGLVSRVFFSTPYRINEHLNLNPDRLRCYRVMPSGFVIDWLSGNLIDAPS